MANNIEKKEKFNEGAFLKDLTERLSNYGRITCSTEAAEAFVTELFLVAGWRLGKESDKIEEGHTFSVVFNYDDEPAMKLSSTKKDGAFQMGIVIKGDDEKELPTLENETSITFSDQLIKRLHKKVLANHGYGIKDVTFLEILVEVAVAELINFTKKNVDEETTFVLVIEDIISFIGKPGENITAVAEKELKKLIKNDAALLED